MAIGVERHLNKKIRKMNTNTSANKEDCNKVKISFNISTCMRLYFFYTKQGTEEGRNQTRNPRDECFE